MPLVKIHVSSDLADEVRANITEEVRNALVEVLRIDEEHGHVILYVSPKGACPRRGRVPAVKSIRPPLSRRRIYLCRDCDVPGKG